MSISTPFALSQLPTSWERLGLIMERGRPGEFDSSVTGDPCIVWDDTRGCWHMLYFGQKQVNGREVNCDAHAISQSATDVGPGDWQKLGPLTYDNPEALWGDTHKPWLLMDPYHPNVASRIAGKYHLFTVTWRGRQKAIQMATSTSLDGPWQVQPEPVVDVGPKEAFDGYHADAVTAYWFEKRGEILIFYMGYPATPQAGQPDSPYGASNAAAVLRPGDKAARKVGKSIAPSQTVGHWTAGYIGGLQIFPAWHGGWYGILNASPTPPAPVEVEPDMREPAPSVGGWAYTPEGWPVNGWEVAKQPIEWIRDIPASASAAGEGVNLWRHHVMVLPNGEMYLYYNTGAYGQERMFGRRVQPSTRGAEQVLG